MSHAADEIKMTDPPGRTQSLLQFATSAVDPSAILAFSVKPSSRVSLTYRLNAATLFIPAFGRIMFS
jgi:hypothetical protein